MSRDSVDGQPLLRTTSSLEKLDHEYNDKKPASSWRRTAFIAVSVALNVVFLVSYALPSPPLTEPLYTCPPQPYSPAQDVLEYVPKLFNGIWVKSQYNAPPSPAVDQAWEDLYSFGIMQIPKSQAALLPNRTAPIPGDEQNYIFTMDVFHQLHCLNMIRQAIHPEYYNAAYYEKNGMHSPFLPVHGHEGFDHMGHCIDSLRETLTCSADLTPLVWTWDQQDQQTTPRLEVVHSCRNFEKIQDWARAHTLKTEFNSSVHVEDDLVIPQLG